MSASLSGLVLTIVNSAVFYKPSIFKIDSDKIFYYDFLQRDLLPFLNLSAAKSLGNFKDVLNHFISRFGENMDEYKDSGELLNDNLQKQQAVLEEINKLSLTRTASKVSEIFADLKSSSEHLERFKEYQQGLNDYIDRSEKVTDNFQQIISNFEDFNLNLKSLGSQIVSSVELQNQLKSSLEIHFPTMKDHREVWRSHVDELNEDIKEVYDGLNDYFESSTERIKKYVNDNDSLFQAIEVIQNSIKSFALSSQAQQEQFKELSSAIVAMRTDFSTAREASDELNKNLLDVVVEMKTQLVKSNIHIIPNGQK
jgi:chromosome segregation ATPase